MKNKILALVILIVVVFTGVFIAQNKKATPGRPEEVKIGFVLGLTGYASDWGQSQKNGALLAIDEINSDGGINGKPIKPVFEDSQTDSKFAVSAYNKLTKIDKVEVVVGDVWDFLTNSILPLSEKDGVTLISPTTKFRSIAYSRENATESFYTLSPSIENSSEAIEKYLKNNPNVRTASIIYVNGVWGETWSDGIVDILQKNGVRIQTISIGSEDFGSNYRQETLDAIKDKPDLLFMALAGITHKPVIEFTKGFSPDTKILTTSSILELLQTGVSSKYDTVSFVDWVDDKGYSRKYLNKYGVEPILESQSAYETIYSIKRALEANPDDILAGLKTVKYETETKVIDFTTGDPDVNKTKAELFVIENGKPVLVK